MESDGEHEGNEHQQASDKEGAEEEDAAEEDAEKEGAEEDGAEEECAEEEGADKEGEVVGEEEDSGMDTPLIELAAKAVVGQDMASQALAQDGKKKRQTTEPPALAPAPTSCRKSPRKKGPVP